MNGWNLKKITKILVNHQIEKKVLFEIFRFSKVYDIIPEHDYKVLFIYSYSTQQGL